MLSKNNLKNTLLNFKEDIDQELKRYFDNYSEKNKHLPKHSRQAINMLREYVLRGGKRYRAALMYYTYLYTGGRSRKSILYASMFMEFLQAYALIHDDIIDQSELRRGKPSLHKIYEKVHEFQYEKQDPVHFGESMGINLGDICAHMGFSILAESNFKSQILVEALKVAHELSAVLYQGQLLDIVSEVENDIKEKDIEDIQTYKTAVYTFKMPMYLGAILAGHHPSKLKTLDVYSINCGIAYQIQDDILGMFGEEEVTGKPASSDIKEGKQTLLILKALKSCTEEEKDIIMKALGNPNIKNSTVRKVRNIIKETGSLEYSQFLAYDLVSDANRAILNSTLFDESGKVFFTSFSNTLLGREN